MMAIIDKFLEANLAIQAYVVFVILLFLSVQIRLWFD